eukprot:NODE_153_length_15389_cov_1.201439.p11 type:complete len:176 gc:universal NODE_153_length_15389_cov_1.201439:10032-9505(-)
MSVNSVTLNSSKLPIMGDMEKIYNTTEKVQLDLVSGEGFPGQKGNYFANLGTLFLTNRRIIYIPNTSNEYFQSLSVPLHFIESPTLTSEGIFSKVELLTCSIKPTQQEVIQSPKVYMLDRNAFMKLYFHDKKSFEFHAMMIQLKSRPQNPTELPQYDNLYNLEDVDPVPEYSSKK